MTDQDWSFVINECRAGSEQAWRSLVQRTLPTVVRVVASVSGRDKSAIDDIVQETYLRAFTRINQLRKPGAVKGWIAQLARSAACDWARRCPQQFSLDEGRVIDERGDASERSEARLALRVAVEALPQSQRTVVIDRYYRGCSYRQIGRRRDISVEAVRGRLRRAIPMIKDGVSMEQRKMVFTLSSRDLRTLGRLAEFTANETRYPSLQGVLVEERGFVTASDGRKLLRRRLEGLSTVRSPVLLGPWSQMDQIGEAEEGSLEIGGDEAIIRSGTEVYELNVMTEVFPDISRLVPTEGPLGTCSLSSGEAIRLAGLLESTVTESRPTTVIELRGSTLLISPRIEGGEFETNLILPTDDEVDGLIRLGINTRYLISALHGAAEASRQGLEVEIRGSSVPVVFRPKRAGEGPALVAPLEIPA